ncbi:MAG: hypothetical protein FWG79_04670 [Bacteroidales bacterium]|nr:hypothetical protein [Bacteroidales bacterium]
MKKTLKLLTLITVFGSLFLTTSCNKDDDKNPFVGTWKMTETGWYSITTFNANMSFVETIYEPGEPNEVNNGTYSYVESSKTLTMIIKGQSIVFSYVFSGNTLVITRNGASATLVKQ